MGPDIDDLVVPFIVGDKAHAVVGKHLLNLLVTFLDEQLLFFRNYNVVKVEREAADKCHPEPEILDCIKEFCGFGSS
ncbi:MAG: hypothetical protein BWY89_01617 [Bacteroidetes bacterium ADurb.BinA012]|nr:MAG: hypothetical protein BWY89_01617 [Bacteroidetes bacterium ADurb.BinA012]